MGGRAWQPPDATRRPQRAHATTGVRHVSTRPWIVSRRRLAAPPVHARCRPGSRHAVRRAPAPPQPRFRDPDDHGAGARHRSDDRIFSVVDALLVRQLPYRDPERIVLLFEAPTANPAAIDGVSPANFLDWKAQVQSLEFLSAAEPFGYTYTSGDEPQMMPGTLVSSGFFETYGMDALYGRTFTTDEYAAGRNHVAVLSHGTWTERFGADREIVGRVIRLNGQPTRL